MVKNLPTVERSTKIRFGKHALEDQAENTIVFNASDTELQANTAGAVYLSPIRFRENFSDSQIVLLMYNKSTGEITESGSSASTAVEPPLSIVTSFGNTTPHTIEFTNPTTAFTTAGNVHINGDLEIQGNVQFSNGTITEIKNTDLVVEDRIIGIANNNTQTGLDTGIIMNYPNQNVGIIHHGDENPKRLSIGYTQNSSTDTAITPDSNNITLDVLGDLKVQNNAVIGDQITTNSLSVTTTVSAVTGTFSGDVSGVVGTFTGDVSGVAGTFTGAVSGASVTDGTGTLSGGAWSGSAATLTNARTIGGVSFDGSQNIVPTTFGDISATDGTFTGNVEAATGAFEGTLSSAAFTATSAEITTGNLTVNTNAILVDAANKKVGIGKTPVANLDVLGNVYASGGITSADLITGDGGGLSNIQVSSLASDVALGTDTSGDYVQTVSGGDGVTVTGGTGESSTPSVALDLKADGGLVIETNELALKLDATSITGTLAVTDGGTGVTTKTGTVNVVLSDSPTLTGTLTGAIADFSGAVTGASYTGGGISGTTGTFSSTLSSAGFTATSAQINGVLNTTGNLTVNTNAILVDATNKKVGIGKTPGATLDVSGNVYASGLITGDGGGLSNIQVSSLAGGVTLGTDTSGDYVQTVSGGDGVTVTGGTGESSTPSVALDLKADGGLVIETNELALKLDATSITGTLAVTDGGTGVTTKTGTGNVVLSDSPTLTGTLTGEIADFSGAVTGASYSGGAISGTTGTFTGAVQGASYSGGAISGTTGVYTGVLTVSDNTSATSNAIGALVVSGGIGAIGNVYSGDLYASAGLDHCSYIGTSKIGYDGTNTGDATFAHYNNMNGTDYAIKQDSTGATKINAKTGYGISLGINNTENVGVTSAGDFKVNANTLYVDASGERVGIRTSSPAVNRTLDVVGNVYASQNITAAGSLTVNDGLIINAGGVTKKFYSYSGTIPHNTVVADAAIKLTFSSNIFYAKIVAHLVEDSTEFSNMSLEVGGGSRAGGANPTLKLGSVSVFGNTSTNPWQSTPVLGASTITIKPSSTINDGGGSATALYNLFIEYITPDATNGKLLTIHLGTNATAIKTFNY